MREKIDCFLPCADIADLAETIGDLSASKTVQHIHLLTGEIGRASCRERV